MYETVRQIWMKSVNRTMSMDIFSSVLCLYYISDWNCMFIVAAEAKLIAIVNDVIGVWERERKTVIITISVEN